MSFDTYLKFDNEQNIPKYSKFRIPYNKRITYLAILGNIGRTATTSDRYYVFIDLRGALEGKPLARESNIFPAYSTSLSQ